MRAEPRPPTFRVGRLGRILVGLGLAALSTEARAIDGGPEAVDPTPAEPTPAPTRATAVRENPDGEQDPVEPVDAGPRTTPTPVHTGHIAAPPMLPRARIEGNAVLVPAGVYTVGTDDPKAPKHERPRRNVYVASVWMDRTEVSVARYRGCVDAGSCARPQRSSGRCTYDRADPQLPVTCVRWADAVRFCRYEKKRLPTEAEWEATARGPNGDLGPWGGCMANVTLVTETTARSCGAEGPGRVGVRPAGQSPLGALDLRGNVEEWVEDYFQELMGSGPPRVGASHVLRGGGWLSPPSQARVFSRSWGSVIEAGPNVGFRCAKDP